MNQIIGALTEGFGQMASYAMSGIASIIPVVLPIMTGIILIGIIVKVVRRITGR